MRTMGTTNSQSVSAVAIALAASLCLVSASLAQGPAPAAAQPLKGIVVRGCLMGAKLTRVEPVDSDAPFPASLGVNGIRAIRSQLKALKGHEVELIGNVEGVGQQKNGFLVADSDKGRLYIGGGDPNLSEDFRRNVPPTFYAHTVRDIAPTCAAQSEK
jgi:hypothetical protein